MLFVFMLALGGFAAGAAEARARVPAPHISSVVCWPPEICPNPKAVAPGKSLRFTGRSLAAGMVVRFPRRRGTGGRSRTVGARLRAQGGFLLARVPWSAKSGRIMIVTRSGVRSNLVGPITVKRKRVPPPAHASATALDGTGMWIWYVSRSSGGNPVAIAAQARRHAVRTVFVKSSDGTSWWSQFSPPLVAALKGAGLRVCAWQYVYGKRPTTEAALGVRAAQTGADCLVIDAESQYEGKYAQAQIYTAALRDKLGLSYPIGLAGFPYVDYHPAFPYSVFLGPGRAQYNIPQVYWKAIGTTVDRAVSHTYLWNAPYGRQMFPLGQLYDRPPSGEVKRFRQLTTSYGATGMSWWDWQEASTGDWSAISASLPPLPPPLPPGYPLLKRGARGDLVVWAQQHLMSAGQTVSPNGTFDAATEQAVRNLQTTSGLAITGQLDTSTWATILRFEPVPVDWTKGRPAAARSAALRNGRGGPDSARLPAVRDEIHAKRH